MKSPTNTMTTSTNHRLGLRVALALLVAAALSGNAPSAVANEAAEGSTIAIATIDHAGPVDFEREILPILRRNCLACHSETEAEAGLTLETPATIQAGGDSGAAVVPGRGSESLLLDVCSHQAEPIMPPEDNDVEAKNLTPAELGLLKLWIDQGAQGEVSGNRNIQLRSPVKTLQPVFAVAMAPHGDYVAAGRGNQVHIYHVPTQQAVATSFDPASAHVDLLQSLAASPDGTMFASGGFRNVKLWRKQPYQPGRVIASVSQSAATSDGTPPMAVNASGTWAATADDQNTILLHDLTADKTTQTFTGHTARIVRIGFSPDETRLATQDMSGAIRAWNLTDGTQLGHYQATGSIAAICFSPDGTKILIGGEEGSIRVWDPATTGESTENEIFAEHTHPITSLVPLGRAGDQFAAATRDGKIHIDNIISGETVRSMAAGGPIANLVTSGDGKMLAAVTEAGVARLVHTATGQPLIELKTNVAETRAIDDARRKAANAKKVLFWANYDRKEIAGTVKRAEQRVKQVAADLQTLIDKGIGSTDKTYLKAVEAIAFRANDLKQLSATMAAAEAVIAQRQTDVEAAEAAVVQAEKDAAAALRPIRRVAFASGDKQIVAIDDANRVHVMAAADGTPIETLPAEVKAVDLAAAADRQLLLRRPDGKLQAWRPGEWSHHKTIGAVDDPDTLVDRVTALAFSPDGKLLVTGGGETARNGELKLWDAATGKLVREIEKAHTDTILGLEFSQDGTLLASCGTDRTMRVFNVATGERVQSFEYHTSYVMGVSWRADGRLLVTAGADNVVRVWNFKTGNEHKVIKRFDDKEVTGIQFLGNGGDFVVSGANRTVSRWNYNGGDGKRYDGVASFMYAIDADAAGQTIVAGGHNGTVHVWNRAGKTLATFR